MPPKPHQVAIVDHDLCDECGMCMPLCPPEAMHMTRKGLIVDKATCTGCVKCIGPAPTTSTSTLRIHHRQCADRAGRDALHAAGAGGA